MFANDDNEKNIKTYANLLQNIREGKEGIDEATSTPVVLSKSPMHRRYAAGVDDFGKPNKALHARAQQHSKRIHTILDRYDSHHPSSSTDGSHLRKSSTELAELRHHHNKLGDIHRAHATFHRIAGNHDAAEIHSDIEDKHYGAAEASDQKKMRTVPAKNRESHEEFDHLSTLSVQDGDDALKNHPITTEMLTKLPAYKPAHPGITDTNS